MLRIKLVRSIIGNTPRNRATASGADALVLGPVRSRAGLRHRQRRLADIDAGHPVEQHIHLDHLRSALNETPLGGTSAMDTDPRARSNNQTHPRSPHRTLLRALRHQSETASPSGPTILILTTRRSRSSARTPLAPRSGRPLTTRCRRRMPRILRCG